MMVLPWLALAFLAAGVAWFGARKPGYRHGIHTISELGEVGAPDQHLVAWGLFLPAGLALLPLALLWRETAPAVAGLAACLATGYLVAAAFPCDPGSPVGGSWRQGVHNLGGGVEYVGGGLCLLAAAEAFGDLARTAGFLALAVAALLTVLPAGSPRGLVQRFGEVALFGALGWLAVHAPRGA